MTEDLEALKSRCRRLAELRHQRDEDETRAANSKREHQEYERELQEDFEAAGLKKTITFDFGPPLGTIAFTPRKATIYARVLNEDAARLALEREGRLNEISVPALRKKRLNELVRQRLEDGEPLPEGIDWYESGGITISHRG